MNILEAITHAKEDNMVIRRAGWPEGKELFWKDGRIFTNNPETDRWEEPLAFFRPESVMADDWIAE